MATYQELETQRDWARTNAFSYHDPYLELESMLEDRAQRAGHLALTRLQSGRPQMARACHRVAGDMRRELALVQHEFADCECEAHQQEDN